MMYRFFSVLLIGGMLVSGASADSAKKHAHKQSSDGEGYAIHRHGRGGYSYDYSDAINTYRRPGPPSFQEQSVAGPFDNGFFFDSAAYPRGGNAPYMQ